MIATALRKLAQPWLWRAYRRYNNKDHWHSVDGLKIFTAASVFHPRWFLTTRTLTDFALSQITNQNTVLELGAGNGLLALSCSRAGAQVTASDINPAAVSSIRKSAEANQLSLEVLESDLFVGLSDRHFDFLFVNPPFFPGEATNDRERAFLCGAEFEYFHQFFEQWEAFAQSKTYMILTSACELNVIENIAKQHRCQFDLVQEKKTWGEEHFIFAITQK